MGLMETDARPLVLFHSAGRTEGKETIIQTFQHVSFIYFATIQSLHAC